MSEEKRNILNTINSPDDLKKVPEDDLIQLCKEPVSYTHLTLPTIA